jgi:hypothetical protein
MSRPLSLTAATVAMLAILAVAIVALEDRQTTVPSPEVVTESLARQLHAHRFRQTRQYMSQAAQRSWEPHKLRAWWDSIERQVGDVRAIDSTRQSIDGRSAEAQLGIQGTMKTMTLDVPLQWERGVWVVTGLPAIPE